MTSGNPESHQELGNRFGVQLHVTCGVTSLLGFLRRQVLLVRSGEHVGSELGTDGDASDRIHCTGSHQWRHVGKSSDETGGGLTEPLGDALPGGFISERHRNIENRLDGVGGELTNPTVALIDEFLSARTAENVPNLSNDCRPFIRVQTACERFDIRVGGNFSSHLSVQLLGLLLRRQLRERRSPFTARSVHLLHQRLALRSRILLA